MKCGYDSILYTKLICFESVSFMKSIKCSVSITIFCIQSSSALKICIIHGEYQMKCRYDNFLYTKLIGAENLYHSWRVSNEV